MYKEQFHFTENQQSFATSANVPIEQNVRRYNGKFTILEHTCSYILLKGNNCMTNYDGNNYIRVTVWPKLQSVFN